MNQLKYRAALGAVLLGLVLCGALRVANALPSEVPVRVERLEAAKVADLAWLSGSWNGEGLGGITDEQWSEPAGGTLVGTFRLLQEDKTSMSLFLVIEEQEDGVFLRFQHFGPGYQAWEEHANVFRLEKLEGENALFRCPNEKQELRSVSYRITKAKELLVGVESRKEDGTLSSFELMLQRKEVK